MNFLEECCPRASSCRKSKDPRNSLSLGHPVQAPHWSALLESQELGAITSALPGQGNQGTEGECWPADSQLLVTVPPSELWRSGSRTHRFNLCSAPQQNGEWGVGAVLGLMNGQTWYQTF